MARLILFELFLWNSCLYALIRGGRDERLVTLILAADFTGSPLLVQAGGDHFASLETKVLLLDAVAFVGLLAVALRSKKYWPLWVTAMQGVVILSHLSAIFGDAINAWTYGTAVAFWSYPQLTLLALATWMHRHIWPRATTAATT